MARSPNSAAGNEAAGDTSVSAGDNAVAATAAVPAPDAAALGLSVPQPLPDSATPLTPVANVAPTVSIPIADRSIAEGPGTVLWRDQGGVELVVKTN